MSNNQKSYIPAQRLANLVLDVATYLLASGAHCGRVNRNINRMANVWGFEVHLNLTFKGVTATVIDRDNENNMITSYRDAPGHNIHLNVLSETSHLSWRVHDEKLSIREVEKQFSDIKAIKPYSNLVVAVAVACSCAGLCYFSFGDHMNATVAFLAAFSGYMTKVFLAGKKFNPMIVTGVAAFTTTFITGLGTIFEIGSNPQAAMATAVLYLIPGVPLINSVIDLIEGYTLSSLNRMLFGGFTLLCIAVGMTLAITLFGINYF